MKRDSQHSCLIADMLVLTRDLKRMLTLREYLKGLDKVDLPFYTTLSPDLWGSVFQAEARTRLATPTP